MPCIGPDGKITETGKKVLIAINAGMTSPEDIAKYTGMPLWWIRSRLRELTQFELVAQAGENFRITAKGLELVAKQ